MRSVLLVMLATVAVLAGFAPFATIAHAAGHLSSTAQLVHGAEVLPGSARPFDVQVTNTSAQDLLGRGARINYVSIILPSAAGVTTNPDVTPPAGWTVQITDSGSLQRLKFQTASASIAPGSSLSFAFPADVATPETGDQEGSLRVAVSDNGGITTAPASGDLRTSIRVLEIAGLAAAAPAGVTDQTATGGQSITYDVTVRNHARRGISVSPGLASDHASDAIGGAPAQRIASGKTRTFALPVTLAAATGQRTFTGDAAASGADAMDRQATLTVQAAPALTLDASTFTPKAVRANAPLKYAFSVTATKSNPPALALDTCTLRFAATTTRLADSPRFGEGSGSRTLSFRPTAVTGAEGVHSARFTCSGVDGNDHPVAFDLHLADLISIDDTVPVITLDLTIPEGQDAVKSGDTVTIRGSVDGGELDYVRLRTNIGETFPCTPSGTRDFACDVRADFAGGTTEVLAEAQATDAAGNVGGAASDVVEVDLLAPELTVARTLSTRQLLVWFDEQNVIRGGCDPAQWSVEGHVVARVFFSNGDDCTTPLNPSGRSGPAGAPSNYRILVLADQLAGSDETPLVQYTRRSLAAVSDNVRDGAANLADTAQRTAVPGILPPAPELVAVTRGDSANPGERERAVRAGAGTKAGTDTYWTNQSGDDLRVEFAGAREGYRVQVVDGSGRPLSDEQQVTSASGGGTITVPIGRTDARYVRGLRLINAAGPGEPAYFDVMLDRVTPLLRAAAADGDTVTVSFTEVLAFGSDFANDWYAWEQVTGGREYYQANRVDQTGDGAERLLTVPFENRGPFGGADYVFTSAGPGAARYEDRAGNQLADSHSFKGAGSGGTGQQPAEGVDGAVQDPSAKSPTEPEVGGEAGSALALTGAPLNLALMLAAVLLTCGLALRLGMRGRRDQQLS